ncbi:hypothetical protein [Micromonospora sp. NPDC051141]|uniref:hypothetical protein n=1 Tax=Micromonospora sp. NPDC051141 TaxID=3364284 RepID=UPI00379EBB80
MGDILGYEWEVTNHSDAPVFNLRIRLIDPAGNLVLRVVEDGEELDYQSVAILDKTERRRWVLASSIEKAEPVRIVVEYTDTNGLMWGRSGGSRPWRIRFSALLPRRSGLGHR